MAQPIWQLVEDPKLREVVKRLQEQIDALKKQVK